MTKKRIIVIDDDIPFLDVLTETLTEEFTNFTFEKFHDSVEAIKHLQKYDLIITDYRMPVINGEDIIRESIRLNKKNIILISGEFPEEIIKKYESSIQLFRKPLTLNSLIDLIRGVLIRQEAS